MIVCWDSFIIIDSDKDLGSSSSQPRWLLRRESLIKLNLRKSPVHATSQLPKSSTKLCNLSTHAAKNPFWRSAKKMQTLHLLLLVMVQLAWWTKGKINPKISWCGMLGCAIFHVKNTITHHPPCRPHSPPHILHYLTARERQGERKIEHDRFDKNGIAVKVYLFCTDTVQTVNIMTIYCIHGERNQSRDLLNQDNIYCIQSK